MQHGRADDEIKMVVREIELVKIRGRAGDFSFMCVEELEGLRHLFPKQLGRKIRDDDFHHLGQLGQFGAQPCRASADFQHAPAKFEAAFFYQEGNELREVLFQTAQPLGFVGKPGVPMIARRTRRELARVRQPQEIILSLHISGLGRVQAPKTKR